MKAMYGEVQKFIPPVEIQILHNLKQKILITQQLERKKKNEVNSLGVVDKNTLVLKETRQRRWVWK